MLLCSGCCQTAFRRRQLTPEHTSLRCAGKSIAVDIARGLAFLHANKIIHRDLKSKNVLLTQAGAPA